MGFSFKGLTSNALVSAPIAQEPDHKDVADVPAAVQGHTNTDVSRPDEKLGTPRSGSMSGTDDEELNKVDTTAESGVQAVQAATHVWTKRDLIIAYVIIWLINFFVSFTSSSVGTLAPYITSEFQAHSLTALTSVISSLIAGIWKLPYAKIMNIWGRPVALCIGVSCYLLGLILIASCKNVQTFCAANVFFYTGYNSIDFSITVFVADTSKLKNRGFYVGYVASPWLITTWVYGPALDRVLATGGIGWRWCIGIFCILAPFVCAPLIYMLFANQAKARRQGLLQPHADRGTIGQKIVYYAKEFDVIGLLILATGLSLFLLAFNLYSLQADLWKSPMIICFLIFGPILIIAFGAWEKWGAPVTFIPWTLLKNRTVIFTYTMAFTMYLGWYIWDNYFYSMLVVMKNQPVTYATYIANIYTMGSCFISLVYGLCLRYYGKLKIYSLVWGVPLMMLGVGLMIHFRQPNEEVGGIIMCMIFIAFGGGVLVISEQTTIMAVSKQQDFPALLAVESMVISIGSAIGSTIAGAIWTGIFPVRLMQNLPAEAMERFAEIYGDIDVQSSYAWGSATRDAINLSYEQTQRYMLIAAVCIYVLTWVSVALWQNVDVRTMKQRTIGLL